MHATIKTGNRICGLLQLEEHVHGADCIKTVELSDEEVAKLNETTAEEIIDVEKTTAADDNTNNEETTAADGESAADENGGETTAAGNGETAAEETTAAEAAAELTQLAETENYIVTVTYTSEAQIPENAVLQVIEYAKDSERFKERTEELGYEPEWLLNVGFFVDSEEVEPAAPVNVKVTMWDSRKSATMTSFTSVKMARKLSTVSAQLRKTAYLHSSRWEASLISQAEAAAMTAVQRPLP